MYSNRSSFLSGAPITRYLLLINVLCFLAFYVADLYIKGFNSTAVFGMHFVLSPDFYPFQFVTYMFMHGNLPHLFFNMFALYMFGYVLEHRLGSKRFLIYYMVAGLGAALVQQVVNGIQIWHLASSLPADEWHEYMTIVKTQGVEIIRGGENYVLEPLGRLNALMNSAVVGASGSVFGILLAFGLLFPDEELYFFFIPIPIKAKYVVIIYGVIELFLGVANFSFDNIAHFAHLGGALFGFILLKIWGRKYIL